MPQNIITTLVALLLLVTLLPLSRRTGWWIRDLDFPRLQIAIGALLLLAAQLVMLELDDALAIGLLAVTAGCLPYQTWWIVP